VRPTPCVRRPQLPKRDVHDPSDPSRARSDRAVRVALIRIRAMRFAWAKTSLVSPGLRTDPRPGAVQIEDDQMIFGPM
jgi:hypothetical protein